MTKFEFFADKDTDDNTGRAVYYSILGNAILVLDPILFEMAHNISDGINQPECAKEIMVRKSIGEKLINEAYK